MRTQTDQQVKIAQLKARLGNRARPSFVPKALSEEQVAMLGKTSHAKAVERLLEGAKASASPRAVNRRLDQNPMVRVATKMAAQADVPNASAETNPLLAWADKQSANSKTTEGLR